MENGGLVLLTRSLKRRKAIKKKRRKRISNSARRTNANTPFTARVSGEPRRSALRLSPSPSSKSPPPPPPPPPPRLLIEDGSHGMPFLLDRFNCAPLAYEKFYLSTLDPPSNVVIKNYKIVKNYLHLWCVFFRQRLIHERTDRWLRKGRLPEQVVSSKWISLGTCYPLEEFLE